MNYELKQKIIENETTLRLHSDDLKQIVKKHVALQKKYEEIEKEKIKLSLDLSYKEERLKALRYMNSKLEQKSKEILIKWETLAEFQKKFNEISETNYQMIDYLEDMKIKLNETNEENARLKEELGKV